MQWKFHFFELKRNWTQNKKQGVSLESAVLLHVFFGSTFSLDS